MKEIAYRGGIIQFQLPDHWREETEPDGQEMYFPDDSDSLTLRVSVITASSPKPFAAGDGPELMLSSRAQGVKETLADGSVMGTYSKAAEQDGVPLRLYWWEVAKLLPPNHGRNAIFSFTVRDGEEELMEVKSILTMLDREIRRVRFSPSLGQLRRDA